MSEELVRSDAKGLDLLSKARAMLAQAQTLEEILKVRALSKAAIAAAEYFGDAYNARKLAREAAEIRLRAERKAGAELKRMAKEGKRLKGRSEKESQAVTLSDLAITRMQSSRWQAIDDVDEQLFEKYIEEAKANFLHEFTTSGLMTLAKFFNRDLKAENIRRQPPVLPEGPFRVIVVDPPWPYAQRRPTQDARGYPAYSGMTLEDIAALPVEERADEDSVLWLWATNAFLEESFEICREWGFEYRTLLTWAKNRIGLGDWLRGQTEHCLMASRGKPLIQLQNQSTLLSGKVREHSRKPDEFYSLVESLCPSPEGGRIDLFARTARPGWVIWGAEAHESAI